MSPQLVNRVCQLFYFYDGLMSEKYLNVVLICISFKSEVEHFSMLRAIFIFLVIAFISF